MKLKTTTLLLAASASLLLTANGATIAPVSWKQSNSFSNDRTADNLSNATGMNGAETILYNLDGSISGEPSSANGVSWVTTSNGTESTAATAGRVWIVADLGASVDLGTIQIWNFQWNNNGTTDLSNRGVSQFDILVRNTAFDTSDGTSGGTAINLDNPADNTVSPGIDDDAVFNLGTTNPWTVALSDQSLSAAPNSDTYIGESFDLTGNTARFVAIRVDAHHGGSGIGLGKLRFASASSAGNGFSDWIGGYPEVGAFNGFADDPDQDGLANGVEAWFGTHPGEFDTGMAIQSVSGSATTFSHPLNPTPPSDLSGFYEWSADLSIWHGHGEGPPVGPVVSIAVLNGGDIATVTATASEPIGALFLRFRVNQS